MDKAQATEVERHLLAIDDALRKAARRAPTIKSDLR
jgi:hypothetical protein